MGNLNGFASLRTRPNVPLQVEPKPKRYCTICEAKLRQSNPGPTCARVECCGIKADELTDVERVLIESSERGVLMVAKMRGFVVQETAHNAKPERNAELQRLRDELHLTQAAIGELFGISQNRVCEVLRGK